MTRKLYKQWLSSAYQYYVGEGFTTMSDDEWDHHAKKFATQADKYDELRGQNYDGGSLFWLTDYPDWAKE